MNEQLLERIAVALEKLAGTAADGFVEPIKGKTYLYANTTNGDRWYTLDDNMQAVLAPTAALKGTITGLEVAEVERRNKATQKLRTTLETTTAGTFVIESGFDTQFTKGLLSGICALGKDKIKQPVTIQCSQSRQDDKIMFCRMFDHSGTAVRSTYDSETDFEPILRAALAIVNGEPVGTTAPTLQASSPTRDTMIAKSTQLMQLAGLSVEEAREKLQERYGKASRRHLTDEELKSFVRYLETLVEAIEQMPRVAATTVNNRSIE